MCWWCCSGGEAYEYIPDGGYADRLSLSTGSPTNYQATAPTADI